MERSEIGMWAGFLLVMGVVGWYMLEIIRCPYWSKEPVLHTYDLVRRCGVMNSTWKRGMTSYKYNIGVGVGVGGSGITLWKAGDAEYQGAVEKYAEFLKKEWILGVEGDSYTRTFKLSAAELEKNAGGGAVISSYRLAKYPWWDSSFSGGLDASGGGVEGCGWMMTYPVYYWISEPGISCGGVLGDIWGSGWGNEKEGETWKVDYLCISRGGGGEVGSISNKDGVEVVRTLFTTHLYHLIFGVGGGGSGIRRNSALFRGDPMSESMRKVVPLVRFGVVEVELDEKKIWPLSKRNWSRGRKWVKVDAKNMTIMQFRLWKQWMEGWYSGGGGGGGNGGALGGFQMVGVFPWSMMMDKVATEDWIIWVLFSEGGLEGEGVMEEFDCVLFFRNERCLLEHKDEIRGMAGSGREIFSLVGSWFARGVSVLEGKEFFIRGLREMRRIRKTFRVLRIEGLGYNLGLIAALGVSGGGEMGALEIGKIVNREICAYYFYNRFWGDLEARKCFILL